MSIAPPSIRVVLVQSLGNRVWLSQREILSSLQSALSGLEVNGQIRLWTIPSGGLARKRLDRLRPDWVVVDSLDARSELFVSPPAARRYRVLLMNSGESSTGSLFRVALNLSSRDAVISLSSRSAQCFRLQARGLNIAIFSPPVLAVQDAPNSSGRLAPANGGQGVRYFYVGRMHPEKGLLDLLRTLDGMRRKRVMRPADSLALIGPNTGCVNEFFGVSYPSFLVELRQFVRHRPWVRRHRTRSQDRLIQWLKSFRGIFVSCSTVIDEDFGIAARDALLNGHLAVLSDWGGHADLKRMFPRQVFLVRIHPSGRVPKVCRRDLMTQIKRARKSLIETDVSRRSLRPSIPRQLSMATQAARLLEILRRPTSNPWKPVQISNLSRQIFFQSVTTLSGKKQSFFGYADPLAAPLLSAYGWARAPETS